jgi:hypothetical protein
MKLRVKDRIHTLKSNVEMTEDEKINFLILLKNWHTKRIHPECLCVTSNYNPPKLHVRKSTLNKLFLANNRSNSSPPTKQHSFQCELNPPDRGFKGFLRTKGIEIDEEGGIMCKLKKKNKNSSTSYAPPSNSSSNSKTTTSAVKKGENALRYLFLTWLQIQDIHLFNPGGSRKISGRLFRIMEKTMIDKIELNTNNVFLAKHEKDWYNYRKHRILIAWGDKTNFPGVVSESSPNTVKLPIFSLDDHSVRLGDISILKSVYNSATLTARAVATGYWVLYRIDKNDKLQDFELIFEPAEPFTGIPVESSYEKTMVQYLWENNRKFNKPLIGNVTEHFLDLRPDILLLDTLPTTIIEVAGYQDEVYRQRLVEKSIEYSSKGFNYLEWEGNSDVCFFQLPPISH